MQISLARKILAGFIIGMAILSAVTVLSLRNSGYLVSTDPLISFPHSALPGCDLPGATTINAEEGSSRIIVPCNAFGETRLPRLTTIPLNNYAPNHETTENSFSRRF